MDINKRFLVSEDVERQLDDNALDSDIVRLVPRDSTEPFEVPRCQLLKSSDYFVKAMEWKKLQQEAFADQYMVKKIQQALLPPIWLSLLETPPGCELITEVFDKAGDDSKVSELLVLAVLHECLEGGEQGPETQRPTSDVPAEYNTAVKRMRKLWRKRDKRNQAAVDLHLLVKKGLLCDVHSRVSAEMFGKAEIVLARIRGCLR
ncbi:hypothetical protein LTR37_013760 [Vermiconidia calcicola]|uniref:Uncharacterized protein n=1 Tax=Vermiconidia calcicola TaxID=1690605 RepID=A0ACC3MVL8_9PEZI|nr:hypothetical protein LTR37_013760 [Vermiconidia calcicola]